MEYCASKHLDSGIFHPIDLTSPTSTLLDKKNNFPYLRISAVMDPHCFFKPTYFCISYCISFIYCSALWKLIYLSTFLLSICCTTSLVCIWTCLQCTYTYTLRMCIIVPQLLRSPLYQTLLSVVPHELEMSIVVRN